MARGGKRPGAGRKPGSVNKRLSVLPSKVNILGMSPIDLMKTAAEKLADKGDWAAVAMIGARLAPYVHPKMPTLAQQGARHADQKLQDDLFDPRPAPGPSKPGSAVPDEFDGLLN
jgi:hypothetical protein